MTAQQLKNSILQMAVQGKLVPQDPNDEPASVLLERIRAEKEKLIKEGKIKKKKNPSVIYRDTDKTPYTFSEKTGKEIKDISDEIPFEIPKSWEWCHWGTISQSIQYGYNAPAKESGRIKMVRISDIHNNCVVWNSVPFCEISENEIPTYALEKDDILFARTGGTVGKSFLVGEVPEEAIYAGYLIRTRYSKTQLCPKYLKLFMESELYWSQLRNGTIATAQPNCNGNTLSKLLLPVPPLSEQRRIVAKIEELLPYIEAYEKAETQLSTLNTTFPEALKKSILQQAVMGKLVPQNPDDEPASVLLERIRAEKQSLIKAGKIKKDKHESVVFRRDNSHYELQDGVEHCIDEEIPFELPETWVWCRLGSIFQHNTGKALNSSNHQGTNMPYITTSNLYWNRFELEKLKEMPFTESEIEKCTVAKDDLLVCEGGDIGRAAVWNYDYPMRIQNHIHRLRPYNSVDIYYFYFIFYFYKYAGLIGGKGIGIQGLSSNAIDKLLIPLPPLAEQHRIVEKIEEIMPIINSITK